jgi:hypothetical protein
MDKRTVSFRVDPNIFKAFRVAAVIQDRQLTDLFTEGMQAMIERYGQAIHLGETHETNPRQ